MAEIFDKAAFIAVLIPLTCHRRRIPITITTKTNTYSMIVCPFSLLRSDSTHAVSLWHNSLRFFIFPFPPFFLTRR
ncbi:MAG: hypothetical protein HY883_03590 [Deltaproteobacteria bacterium]|nr:hypothetical protein [Deltaproteobacteria bacterium]